MGIRYSNYTPVESTTVAGARLKENGITILTGSSTSPTWTLDGPAAAGTIKYIVVIPNSTVTPIAVVNTATTGVSVRSTTSPATGNKITFTGFGAGAHLIAATSSQWYILSKVGTVAVANRTT